jgi:cyclase
MSQHISSVTLDPPTVEQVADGCYAFIQPDGSWFINNTGFITSDEGVILIDTCATENRTIRFLDSVRAVTSAPMRILVNTHYHGDHTHGNYLTKPAVIVGNENCRTTLLKDGINLYNGAFAAPEGDVNWGSLKLAPPDLTFSDQLTLWAGDTEVQLIDLGYQAHTSSDLLVWVPEHGVLYTGDLVFNQGTPFVVMGSIDGWLRANDQIRALEPKVIVPGHGPVCDVSVLNEIDDYFDFVRGEASNALDSGVDALTCALGLDLGRFATLSDPERIVGNLHRAMHELKGGDEELGPMPVSSAVADMLTYNGGRPLTCLA